MRVPLPRPCACAPPPPCGSSPESIATRQCNTLDICADGRFFVSGGGDKTVKLWHYDEGSQYYEGQGHSGAIIKAVITPDEQRLVTVGGEGGIFIWKVPEEFQGQGAGAAA